jgi:hypothetical protein
MQLLFTVTTPMDLVCMYGQLMHPKRVGDQETAPIIALLLRAVVE